MNFEGIRSESPVFQAPLRQEINSSYLIVKVALFAISYFATAVTASPLLGLVTIGLGLSILSDLFYMATGDDCQAPRRRNYDGYRRPSAIVVVESNNPVYIPIANNQRRDNSPPVVHHRQNYENSQRVPVGNRRVLPEILEVDTSPNVELDPTYVLRDNSSHLLLGNRDANKTQIANAPIAMPPRPLVVSNGANGNRITLGTRPS